MHWKRIQARAGLVAASLLAGALAFGAASANTVDYSFTGTFSRDDNVQLFNFVVDATSTVTFRTFGYAGGVNAAGNTIARGGFDPILALFDGTGKYIDHNDDGECGPVAADSGTGMCWDAYFSAPLTPGRYTVSVMQFDNYANGPNLSNGFARDGEGNFTAGWNDCDAGMFCDISGVTPWNIRDNHWAFDILNVGSAVVVQPTDVPEPSALGFLGLGVLLGGAVWRNRRQQRIPV